MLKIFISTQGCSHNYSDSEHMAGLLKKAGYEIVPKESEADIVLFNTCTVKSPTESRFRSKLKKTKKKVVLAGCVTQADPNKFAGYPIIGTRQIDNIVEVVEKAHNGENLQLLGRNLKPELNQIKVRTNPFVEIIPISLGCLSACTFCKTKLARGHLSSYPKAEIISAVRNATSSGAKEIWLTSQDTGCYGFDIDTNAAELLNELVKIGKDFRIRFGMANPHHMMKIKEALAESFNQDKIFKFIHVPVQAGSDAVLKTMRRDHSVSDFVEVVNYFRKQIPNISISTDIICGFPGETEEQFNDTLKLLEKTQPDSINISRFWARPGTAAAKMKQVPVDEIKRRSGILSDFVEDLLANKNKKWLGWRGKITLTERGKNNTFIGKNFAYKQVVVSGNLKLGQQVDVEIVGSGVYDLKGKMING